MRRATVRGVTATEHDHLALSTDYVPGSGGIWLDMIIHDFDTIPWVTGQRVRSVRATGSVLDTLFTRSTAMPTSRGRPGPGLRSSGHSERSARNGAGQTRGLEIFGTLNSFGPGFDGHTPMTSTEPGISSPGPPYDQFIDRFERAFRAEANAFVRLACGTGVDLTPPRDGLVAICIAQAAAESIRSGSTIDLD